MIDALAHDADIRSWALAALADEAEFDSHIETIAAAIADRFALKVHLNIVARRMAFTAWIDSLQPDKAPADYRTFVGACASLIASIARHRIVSYSAMVRDPGDRMIGIVLKYPNDVTALAAGAAIYTLRVGELTGEKHMDPLSPLIVQNAAANLHRHPEAAARFRELLQLSTPWT